MVDVREIPRTYVKVGLQMARLPLTAVEAVVKRGESTEEWPPSVAFEGFEASFKQVVGSLLRDDELVQQGKLKQAKVSQLRKAAELESLAEQREAEADAEFRQRREAAEQRRQQAEQQAQQREAAIEREKAEKKRRADEEARRKEESARKAETATKKAVAKQERAARTTSLTAERQALEEERQAVEAKGEVVELDQAIRASKAARKSG